MAYMKDRGQLIKLARDSGYKGKLELAELKSWMDETNTTFADEGGAIDVDTIWAKKVTVNFDSSADDVEFVDAAEADGEAETLEAEMGDGDEDEAEAKSFGTRSRKAVVGDNTRKITKMSHDLGTTGRIGDRLSAQKKAYDQAKKNGWTYRGSKGVPVYENADMAEAMGASIRLTSMGAHPYSQKSMDERIVAKAGSTFNPATGGILAVGEYSTNLIELFNQYGVARRAAGVTPMSEGELTIPRLDSDVTVYDVGENDAITASDEGYSDVTLNATKTAALKRLPMELLNDSALNVADIISRSMARAVAKWEDEAYLLGSHNRTGIADLFTGAGTDQFDSNSGGWASITVTDMQSAIGMLPGWAHAEGVEIITTPAFKTTVLDSFGLSAGGNTGADLQSGFPNGEYWGSYPVHLSTVMQSSYSDGTIVAYVGAFKAATKFGLVTGSEEIASTDQRYFENDQFAIRYKQRWAINCHDVGGANSGVIALLA